MSEESLIEREEEGRSGNNVPMEVDAVDDDESLGHPEGCCEILGGFEDIDADTPMEQLEAYLARVSNISFRRPKGASLIRSRVAITRSMLTLLVPLFPHPDDDNDNMDTSPGTAGNATPVYFANVRIEGSVCFFSPTIVNMAEGVIDICTQEDKRRFCSALARVSSSLEIEDNCPEIVSGLLSIPEIDGLAVERLVICQKTPLASLEYSRLGTIIQRSVHLTDLVLLLPFVDAPREFYDSLANSIHIESLSLRIHFQARIVTDEHRDVILSKLLVGDNGNGAVERFLRNPQNRLIELDLDLDDQHLIPLAQLLPTSHVQDFDFRNSRIRRQGLYNFARQRGKMHSLYAVSFQSNPWEYARFGVRQKCGTALTHALMENPSIQYVNNMDDFPQCALLWHYLSLNRGGRQFLTPSASRETPILDGLWPRILARAGKNINNTGPCVIPLQDEDTNYLNNGPANAVFFFLQNCPKIFSYCT